MEKTQSIVRSAAQRLRELLPKATGWEEHAGLKVGGQKADLVMKFKFGGDEQTLLLEITSLGQPRQIRETITRLGELRAELGGAYPVAVAQYISPQGAAILKRNGLGYLDLSGNCHLAFGNVLIEQIGIPLPAMPTLIESTSESTTLCRVSQMSARVSSAASARHAPSNIRVGGMTASRLMKP